MSPVEFEDGDKVLALSLRQQRREQQVLITAALKKAGCTLHSDSNYQQVLEAQRKIKGINAQENQTSQ